VFWTTLKNIFPIFFYFKKYLAALKRILHKKCFESWSQKKSEAELHEYVSQRGDHFDAFSLLCLSSAKAVIC
jgi:hypothetical protein